MLADDVLGRLPPSSLAAARCVCKHWRSIIDGRRLLHERADLLLPLRLDGIFCNSRQFDDQHSPYPYFFTRPPTAHQIAGHLDMCFPLLDDDDDYGFLNVPDRRILDHCNGLLLLGWNMAVVNPATRQWAPLPPFPKPSLSLQLSSSTTITMEGYDLFACFYLVYDPMAVSQHHFEVFLIPDLTLGNKCKFVGQSEWPPSPYTIHVFSSTTWKWEQRSFVRQGDPTGTIADTTLSPYRDDHHGVYFRGALYVHCQDDSVMRITLSSDNKYQMIAAPSSTRSKLVEYDISYLGKSEKGVYFSLLYEDDAGWPHFRVWLLNNRQMEWVLSYDISLKAMFGFGNFTTSDFDNGYNKPWILADCCDRPATPPPTLYEIIESGKDEWDFIGGGIILETKYDNAEIHGPSRIVFLGFHPYKEVAVFWLNSTVICYQLNTSTVQELGDLQLPFSMETSSFLYTPCWMQIKGLISGHD
ncbi:hypothetical protein BS78_04G000600 [Paspalum vaginatum]|nr:hypothetical protein BS78_04G000600 [Paspalum vaginatum]